MNGSTGWEDTDLQIRGLLESQPATLGGNTSSEHHQDGRCRRTRPKRRTWDSSTPESWDESKTLNILTGQKYNKTCSKHKKTWVLMGAL